MSSVSRGLAAKANAPTSLSEGGSDRVVSPLQRNADLPTVSNPSGRTASVMSPQYANASSPMPATQQPPMLAGMTSLPTGHGSMQGRLLSPFLCFSRVALPPFFLKNHL